MQEVWAQVVYRQVSGQGAEAAAASEGSCGHRPRQRDRASAGRRRGSLVTRGVKAVEARGERWHHVMALRRSA
jgi:hypothetical protein